MDGDGANWESPLSERLRERHGEAISPMLRGYRVREDSTLLLRLGFDPTETIDAETLTSTVGALEGVERAAFVVPNDEAAPTADGGAARLLAVHVADGASDRDEIAQRVVEALSRVLLERYRIEAQRSLLGEDD